MKKLSSKRPPVLTMAAIAIAMIALIATFGGIAIGKKKHKAHPVVTTTTVTIRPTITPSASIIVGVITVVA